MSQATLPVAGLDPGKDERAGRRPASPWRGRLESFTGLFWNPIVEKEVLSRMRSWRAPAAISVFILILTLFGWGAVAIATSLSANSGAGVTPGIGLGIFGGLMGTELVLIIFLAPALTAGAISGEKERQTLDLLMVTRVRPGAIVTGKLVSSMLFILLLVLISVPLLSFIFLFGGVEVDQVLVTTLVVMVTAIGLGSVGIFCSALIRNTIGSTVVAYILSFVLLVAPAILPFFITAVTAPQSFLQQRGQPIYQLGEPFYTMTATLAPASTNNRTVAIGGVVSGGTVCTSTPNGGTQCKSTGGVVSPGLGGPIAVPATPGLPVGSVVLQGDEIVEGPLQHWHAWQIFTIMDIAMAALLLFLSTLLVSSGRVARAGRAAARVPAAMSGPGALGPPPDPDAPLPPPGPSA
ncbi:MAG: type transport system permease protein [Chloroflexota bacterium]|jgi:ABC-type transport system involved in multi-copper enzyme maturation permease subunit|nr:type transport system permease protein [Chloroflexota bacterium]